MAFPASRPGSGALTTQAVTAIEAFRNQAMDIVRPQFLLLQLAQKYGFYKVNRTSHHRIDAVIDQMANQTVAFDGYDPLPNGGVKGAQGVTFAYANYASPVSYAWTETEEMRDPYQYLDFLEVKTYKAVTDLANRIDLDACYGNTADAKKINGLEQICYPKDQTTTGLNLKAWQHRQANNTYGGVARTAFTADGVGGTNWENLSCNMKATVSGIASPYTFGFSSSTNPNIPNDANVMLNHIYQLATYGLDQPDVIFSTNLPYEHYSNSMQGLQRYPRTSDDTLSVNLGFTGLRFRQADWAANDRYGTSGLNGDASTAGRDVLYLLNTSTLMLEVSETADFAMTDEYGSNAQLVGVMWALWRGQFVCLDPRKNAILYNYGIA